MVRSVVLPCREADQQKKQNSHGKSKTDGKDQLLRAEEVEHEEEEYDTPPQPLVSALLELLPCCRWTPCLARLTGWDGHVLCVEAKEPTRKPIKKLKLAKEVSASRRYPPASPARADDIFLCLIGWGCVR
jgi:hypothetical protein